MNLRKQVDILSVMLMAKSNMWERLLLGMPTDLEAPCLPRWQHIILFLKRGQRFDLS